jgi:hypothetical protein
MKRIALTLSMVCVVGLLGACSSSGGTASTQGPSGSPTATPSGSASGNAKVGPLTYTPETSATASAVVTPTKGGTVKATATDGTTYTLSVAAYQVAKPVTISLVPLGNVGGIPSDHPISAVKMLPSGLTFNGPAELTIVPAKPLPAATQTMFLADDNGKSLGLALVNPSSKSLTMGVPHFTIAAAASLDPGTAGAVALANFQNIFDASRAELAALLAKERQAQLLGLESSPNWVGTITISFTQVQAALDEALAKNLDNCDVAQQLVAIDLGMDRQRQLLGIDSTGDLSKITGSIAKIYKACEKKAIKQCQDANDPAKLFQYWYGVLRQQALLGAGDGTTLPDGSQPTEERALRLCVSFDMTGEVGPVTMKGHVPDIRKPWDVEVTSPSATGETATFTPTSDHGGKLHGTNHGQDYVETIEGSYTLTHTDTGLTGKGTAKTCIQVTHSCSPSGLLRLTFTRPTE